MAVLLVKGHQFGKMPIPIAVVLLLLNRTGFTGKSQSQQAFPAFGRKPARIQERALVVGPIIERLVVRVRRQTELAVLPVELHKLGKRSFPKRILRGRVGLCDRRSYLLGWWNHGFSVATDAGTHLPCIANLHA